MHNKLSLRLLKPLLTAAITILLCSTWSIAANFSANFVEKHGKMQMTGKTFVKGKQFRRDMSFQGRQMIIIINSKGVYQIDPAKKVYIQSPANKIDISDPNKADKELQKVAVKKNLGTEKVQGYVCDKYQYTFKDKNGGTITQWISKKLKWPIKIQTTSPRGKSLMEYTNIKETAPADSVFKVPAGYKKMSMTAPGRMPVKPVAPKKH